MAGKEAYTVEQVIQAIREGHTPKGAAVILKCHSDTVRNYARRYATVKDALQTERRDLFDLAEGSLRRAVLNGEPWAVALVVKTLGKDDGYSDRTELTGADGGAVKTENTSIVEIRAVDYRTVAAALAPRPVSDSHSSGENEDTGDGAQVG